MLATSALMTLLTVTGAVASNNTVAVFKNTPSDLMISAMTQRDAELNLADDFDIASFYEVDDTNDLSAISMAHRSSPADKKLFIVVSGVHYPETLVKEAATFEIEEQDDRQTSQFARFLAEAPGKLMEVHPDFEQLQLSEEISVFSNGASTSREWQKLLASDHKLDTMWDDLKNAYSQYDAFNSRKLGVINDAQFVKEMTQLDFFLSNELPKLPTGSVATVSLNSLIDIYRHSRDSQTYKTCKNMLGHLLQSALELSDVDTTIVVLPLDQRLVTFKFQQHTRKLSKRSSTPAKKGVASCQLTQEACEDATDSCSGHGSCTQIGKCWTCICSPTVAKGLTTYWAGNSCEKEDISTTFNLLLWTTVVLAFTMAAGVKFMYGCGSGPLPSVLQAATVQTKKSS